jgi:hypothetical protein
MNDVQSVEISGNCCKISLGSEIVSFGDFSIESAASEVFVFWKTPSEAQEIAGDLENKLTLFKTLERFRLHTGLHTSMQQIQQEYQCKLIANRNIEEAEKRQSRWS